MHKMYYSCERCDVRWDSESKVLPLGKCPQCKRKDKVEVYDPEMMRIEKMGESRLFHYSPNDSRLRGGGYGPMDV